MPYFVFKYQDNKFRSVDHIDTFETYKEANKIDLFLFCIILGIV